MTSRLFAALAAAFLVSPAFGQAPAVVQPNPVIIPTEAPPAVDPAKLAPPPEARPAKVTKAKAGKAAKAPARGGKSGKRKLRR